MKNIESHTKMKFSRFNPQRLSWVELCVIVALWGAIALINIADYVFETDHHGEDWKSEDILQIIVQYIVWALLTPGIFWLSRLISLEDWKWPRYVLFHFLVALVVAIGLDTLTLLMKSALESGNPHVVSPLIVITEFRFLYELLLYCVVLLAIFGRYYFLRDQERQRESIFLRADAAQLQANLSEARFQALRMQINPHFLFNTLHTISANLERDPRGARRMIVRLSDLLRYTLDMGKQKEVALEEEMDFLEGYLEIQSIRFKESLKIHQDIAPEVMDALVPNLVLQPLVENAINHGVSKLEADGLIEIRAWREGEALHLSVRDNGPGLTDTFIEGVGLSNTRERLNYLYGVEQSLSLEPANGKGLFAHIVLPYHTRDDFYTKAVSS